MKVSSTVTHIGEDALAIVKNLWFVPNKGFFIVGLNQSSLNQSISFQGRNDFKIQFVQNISLLPIEVQIGLQSAITVNEPSIILMDFEHSFVRHYHHVLEHAIAAVIALEEGKIIPDDVKNIFICYPSEAIKRGNPESVAEYSLKKLFVNAQILYSDEFERVYIHNRNSSTLFSHVIISDRAATHSESYKKTFKLLAGQLHSNSTAWPHARDRVRQRMLSDPSFNLPPDPTHSFPPAGESSVQNLLQKLKQGNTMFITIPTRRKGGLRELPESMYLLLVTALQKRFQSSSSPLSSPPFSLSYPSSPTPSPSLTNKLEVVMVDFEALSNVEQLLLAMRSVAMIGVHGNALTHLVWMPPGSCVVEVLPPQCMVKCYSTLAHIAGINYTAVISQSNAETGGGYLHQNSPMQAVLPSMTQCHPRIMPEFSWTPTLQWMSNEGNCPLLI